MFVRQANIRLGSAEKKSDKEQEFEDGWYDWDSKYVYTDPNTLKNAKKIRVISYEEMLEMSSLGAKVMQPTSIQDARLNRIDINVKSSFVNKKANFTWMVWK